jgi:hypothetical protein
MAAHLRVPVLIGLCLSLAADSLDSGQNPAQFVQGPSLTAHTLLVRHAAPRLPVERSPDASLG